MSRTQALVATARRILRRLRAQHVPEALRRLALPRRRTGTAYPVVEGGLYTPIPTAPDYLGTYQPPPPYRLCSSNVIDLEAARRRRRGPQSPRGRVP